MTQEDKQLLLMDLCGRLPYSVIVHYKSQEKEGDVVLGYGNIAYVSELEEGWWIECKPYLRPLSSMTEEERKEVGEVVEEDYIEPYGEIKSSGEDNLLLSVCKSTTNLQDYLYRKGFDIRGLIPKGLALEAPEGMY